MVKAKLPECRPEQDFDWRDVNGVNLATWRDRCHECQGVVTITKPLHTYVYGYVHVHVYVYVNLHDFVCGSITFSETPLIYQPAVLSFLA